MRTRLLCSIAWAIVLIPYFKVSAQEQSTFPGQESLRTHSLLQHNFSSFTPDKNKQLLSEEVLAMNKGFEQHPELGAVANAPCDNCYEILSKRTETAKTFAQIGSKGTSLYLMNASEPIHYKGEQGKWLTLPQGMKKEADGVFRVHSSYAPIIVNTIEGRIQIGKGADSVICNSALNLLFIDANNKELNLGQPDWSRYTAGDDGVYVSNAWPGIDMSLVLYQGKIKTNYIIRKALPQYQSGKLIIRDVLKFSKNLSLKEVDDNPSAQFALINNTGDVSYYISPAIGFEENNVRNSRTLFPYQKKNDHTLDMIIAGNYLDLPATSYPFIIDPLFSASGTLAAYTMGSKNGGSTDPCSYTNKVEVPKEVTITGLKFKFGYEINHFVYTNLDINHVGFRLRLGPPGTDKCATPVYSCVNDTAGGLIPVQCYTLDYLPVHDDLRRCYPPPQCASYSLPVVLDLYRSVGPIASCIDQSVAWNYLPFVVVVEGRTLELNRPIATNLGSYESCGDPIDLTVNPEYGVPPYTYSWTPGGGDTRSIKVTPKTNQEYTVKVTDVCGNEVSAKANIIVKSPSSSTVDVVICNADLPYNWNGMSLTTAGTHVYTCPNAQGCDSVVTLNLSLIPVKSDSLELRGCNSVVYNNKVYSTNITLQDTTRASSGCDILHRTVNIQIKETQFWMPNAFSPNGDGSNDKFGPDLIGEEPYGYSLKIFDRWGSPIFTSFSRVDKWDGTVNGTPSNVGTYYYHITAKCNDNTPIEEKGSVDLIR